jgi:acyl dehydratase
VPELCFEDFRVGQVAEYGRKLVTADEIKAFAAQFDPQPMHLDEEAARATPFGQFCASGYHTACILMRMIADGFLLRSTSLGGPGVDELKWLAPVLPGDELKVRAHVLSVRDSESRPDMGFVKFLFEVINQSDVVVMTMTSTGMFRRRRARG